MKNNTINFEQDKNGTWKEVEPKNTIPAKVGRGAKLFKDGFMGQVLREDTIGVAAGVGIIQGLKYAGSMKRGVVAGAATLAVLGTVNGIRNVIVNKDKI